MKEKGLEVKKILDFIYKKLSYKLEKEEKNKYQDLQGNYTNTMVLCIDNWQENSKLKSMEERVIIEEALDLDSYQQEIMELLNDQEKIRAYSFLPTGLGHYENKEELKDQLIRQASINGDKYIYAKLELTTEIKIDTWLKDLTENLKDTLLLVIGTKENKIMYLALWKEKTTPTTWTIRPVSNKEYNPFFHMSEDYEKTFKQNRPDMFDGKAVYSRGEFSLLSNPHQLRTLLLYEEDKEMLGFIEGEVVEVDGIKNRTNRMIMLIKELYVVPERRREHIATRLYEELVKKAKKEKCSCIEIDIYNFHKEAILFFESLGFDIQYYRYEKRLNRKKL